MPGASGRNKREQIGIVDHEPLEEDEEYQTAELTTEDKIRNARGDITNTQDNTTDMLDDIIGQGAETNKKLYAQGEQLRRARNDMQDIKENNEIAQEQLEKMELCCCVAIFISCCCCCCAKEKKPVTKRKDVGLGAGEEERRKNERERVQKLRKVNEAKRRADGLKNAEDLDEKERFEAVADAQLDIMNAQLDVVGDLIKVQKEELDRQKKDVLNPLDKEIDVNRAQIKALDRRGKNLLNR
ncbi:hypothetical protein AAMO2058_001179900 [Amorphochlora amoebiformis]|uniref:t-SNARE coiled-coil homology domain-containing protein n=1 Tax=Amorphochlora amoebiformis TaxID=1561963 RepID=A0A7S0DQH1_9EUKA